MAGGRRLCLPGTPRWPSACAAAASAQAMASVPTMCCSGWAPWCRRPCPRWARLAGARTPCCPRWSSGCPRSACVRPRSTRCAAPICCPAWSAPRCPNANCAACSWGLPIWCSNTAGATGCWTTSPTTWARRRGPTPRRRWTRPWPRTATTMQAALYLLALHRLLRARLGAPTSLPSTWAARCISSCAASTACAGRAPCAAALALLAALDALLGAAEDGA